MSGLESTTARLRQTFKYPSDDEGSQTSRDELDEEGNETTLVLQVKPSHSIATYATQSPQVRSKKNLRKTDTHPPHRTRNPPLNAHRAIHAVQRNLHAHLHRPPAPANPSVPVLPRQRADPGAAQTALAPVRHIAAGQLVHDVLPEQRDRRHGRAGPSGRATAPSRAAHVRESRRGLSRRGASRPVAPVHG